MPNATWAQVWMCVSFLNDQWKFQTCSCDIRALRSEWELWLWRRRRHSSRARGRGWLLESRAGISVAIWTLRSEDVREELRVTIQWHQGSWDYVNTPWEEGEDAWWRNNDDMSFIDFVIINYTRVGIAFDWPQENMHFRGLVQFVIVSQIMFSRLID